MITVVSVAAGLALGIRRRSYRPLVYAATIGTIGDMSMGYLSTCRDVIEDYEASLKAVAAEKAAKAPTSPPPPPAAAAALESKEKKR